MIAERLQRLVEEMVSRGVQFEDAVTEFEKRFISHMLRHNADCLSRTADALGMHRNTLARKMREYRIRRKAG